MRITKYSAGGAMDGDPKKEFIERARNLTGKPLDDFAQMNLGLDFTRINQMSDDEVMELFDLIGSLAPEEKGDQGAVIENIRGNFDNIKTTLSGLTENYGVNVEGILDGIIEFKDMGFLKGKTLKGLAKAAGLYAGGGVIKLRV